MNFSEQYEGYRARFEEALRIACGGMNYTPAVLAESMRYSLQAGGKRIRPVLFLAALDGLARLDVSKELDYAVAIECIHTYSLIHDDLPAMDNDDFRRGRPSNHKVFGEANAILAGDALLSYAFDLLLRRAAVDRRHARASLALSRAAGAEGMVAGQSADLFYERKEAGKEELKFIYANKTGRLIAAPLVMAAELAGRSQPEMEEFGMKLGMLFQLTDDILDEKGDASLGKTLGKDKAEGKLTAVRVFGMAGAERLADETAAACATLIGRADLHNADFFAALTASVRGRRN